MVKKSVSMEKTPIKSPLSVVTATNKKAKQKQSPRPNHVEANSATVKRAEKFRLSLGSEFPSFVKPLSQSHVAGGCMKMSLPAKFCRIYLASEEQKVFHVILVDECGREFKVSYNVRRYEVAWGRFCSANKLCMGDIAVFQLIDDVEFKFKVFIIREKDVSETDDPSDMALAACIKPIDYASDSSLGSTQSVNDSEDSDNSDTEDSDNSGTEDSWAMVISGYPKKLERNKRKRSKLLPGSDAIDRAKKIRADLSADFPCCIQPYSQSCHGREYLRLPKKFCRNNLNDDRRTKDVILVSEDDGKEYEMKFIQDWKELNCGWTAFSKCNNLHVGDVLVFCLIGHFRFKVYIVREKELLLSKEATHAASDPDLAGSETDHNVSEEGAGSSVSAAEVKSFDDFTIVVNGMTLDSEMSEELRRKYYELCYSQKSYLHQHLLEHVDTIGWANAIISKIIAISDDIRACTLNAPRSFYESRIAILDSFEKLGMNVRFLSDLLKALMSIAFDPDVPEALRRQGEAKKELSDVKEKTKALELEIIKLQKRKEELVFEIEENSFITKDHESKFLEMAKVGW